MSRLSERLAALPPSHRAALEWFHRRRRAMIDWPSAALDGVFLVNRHVGVHKPRGWVHALSVRQTLDGRDETTAPERRPDGSWLHVHSQPASDAGPVPSGAGGRGMLACMRDDVPVAVIIQNRVRPRARYQVMGLARVVDFRDGRFHLEGYDDEGGVSGPAPYGLDDPAVAGVAETPMSLDDARRRAEALIIARQGGRAFREQALKGFDGACAISGCRVTAVLEAAHVVPYLGAQTNTLDNALLLRADLHTLFDRELLSIDPETLRVVLASALAQSDYRALDGRVVTPAAGVSAATLRLRLDERRRALKGDS